ncbi:MAG: hypothetical protein FWH56_02530 [Betaproteobacteria bacterium]|nr:hypothetical protein [Betaproteobacteria bacterium]
MCRHRFVLKTVLAAVAIGFASQVFAEKAECGDQSLIIATGPSGKGFSKLFADINKVCGQVVPVCELVTTGGLDNLTVLSEKKADLGFAQIDTWTHMKTGDENINALQAIVGLNSNYLHVVTSASGFAITGEKKLFGLMSGNEKTMVINRFSDLRGQRVALVGSAQLLVRQLDKFLDYKMEMRDIESDSEAFNLVRKGEVAAALSVSGWPSGVVAPLKQDSGLTLVPYDAQIPSPQLFVKPITYKGIGVYNNNALAMPNVLLSRPFRGEKSREVAKLRECLKSKLLDLQEGSYQPGWNEIKDIDNTYGIPKFVGK